MNNVYTKAQVELGVADCPVTDYGSSKNKRRKGKTLREKMASFDTPSGKEVKDAATKWQEKYGDGGKPKMPFGLKISKPEVKKMTIEELRVKNEEIM